MPLAFDLLCVVLDVFASTIPFSLYDGFIKCYCMTEYVRTLFRVKQHNNMKSALPFDPRSSICVSGSTGSGKTRWVHRFLLHLTDIYSGDPPERIMYCYGIYQPLFDEMERTVPNFVSRKGIPSEVEIDEFCDGRSHVLLILDDLMHSVVQNPDMELLFTQDVITKE